MSLPIPDPSTYERFATDTESLEMSVPARGFVLNQLLKPLRPLQAARRSILGRNQERERLNGWYLNTCRYLQSGLEMDRDKHIFVGALHLGVIGLELLHDGISYELGEKTSACQLGDNASFEVGRRLHFPLGLETDNDLHAVFERPEMYFSTALFAYRCVLDTALMANVNGPQQY